MKPIEKISVTDHIVKNLTELITSGKLVIGDKMPTEKEICETLKVARSSVREAMRVLKALGYVELIPGRGAFVAKTTEDDTTRIASWFAENETKIYEFMDIRLSIETLAVKLTIQNGKPADFEELDNINEKFKEAMENYNVVQLVTLDELFHKAIVDATHNELLIELYKTVTDSFVDYRSKAFSVKEYAFHALEPHNNISRAIKSRDTASAVKEITHHIQVSIEDVVKVIEDGKKASSDANTTANYNEVKSNGFE
jgi:GntR family transcriptional repressor for pyruvate dehydrogenase complex